MHTNKLIKPFKNPVRTQNGSAILQVLAAMGFLFLLMYGVITTLTNSRLQQKKQTYISNLRETQTRLAFLLKDPDSFRNTMNDAANTTMDCLRNHTACAAGAQQIVNVRDAANNIIFGNLPAWNASNYNGGGGFNESGNICNTFSDQAANSNDVCPFTYKIVWEPLAAGVDPGFRISARLRYSPGNNSPNRLPISMGKMTGNAATDLISISGIDPTKEAVPVVGNTNTQFQDINMGKYDLAIWRTATTSIKGFRVATTQSGVCNTGGTFLPPTNRGGFAISYDPFHLVNIVGGPAEQIFFRYGGTYECDMTAAGNGVLGFQIRLCSGGGNCNGAVHGSGAGFANYTATLVKTQSWIETNAVFTLNSATTLFFRQICQSTIDGADLGINTPPGTNTATLNCRMVE